MYPFDYNPDEECNCQGPSLGCSICSPTMKELKERSDEFLNEIHQPMFNKIMRGFEEPLILKVKWIERTTDKATLVRTKKEWFWIPLSLIVSIKKTNKGWKLKVHSCFKKSPITVDTHHYFERKEYES